MVRFFFFAAWKYTNSFKVGKVRQHGAPKLNTNVLEKAGGYAGFSCYTY